MNSTKVKRYLENLALLMQESAECGDMDSGVYAVLLELMGDLAALLPEVAA